MMEAENKAVKEERTGKKARETQEEKILGEKIQEEKMAKIKKTEKPTVVKSGSTVSITYTGTLDDGTVFDTLDESNPLTFRVGSNKLLKAFEDAIIGMKLNEDKKISLTPEQAYGFFNENLIQEVPRALLEGRIDLKNIHENSRMMFTMPTGEHLYARVFEIGPETIKLDFNHPLAGKNLNFRVKIIAIE